MSFHSFEIEFEPRKGVELTVEELSAAIAAVVDADDNRVIARLKSSGIEGLYVDPIDDNPLGVRVLANGDIENGEPDITSLEELKNIVALVKRVIAHEAGCPTDFMETKVTLELVDENQRHYHEDGLELYEG